MCQKFRSCLICHYNRFCHITMHNMHETWGHHAYIMPCVAAHAVTSCMHCTAHACRQGGHPYVNVVCQKLLMDMPFMPAKLHLRKLTTSHFSTHNMTIANQNVLKRILIAMHNENKANCNENFRICAEEFIGHLYKQ